MIVRFIAFVALVTSALAAAPIRPENCRRAAKYFENTGGVAMLVTQNRRVVFERYANGGMQNGRWPIFSGTKNFWGLAALCAVRDGLFALDDRVADTITEWKNDPRKSQITIRELLNCTSGLEGAAFLHRQSTRDRNASAVRLSIVAKPGTRFIYGPSHLQIVSEVLRRKLSRGSPKSYLERMVTSPLGIRGLEFKPDAAGNALPASGFELTAREWARLGELVLGKGNYRAMQIVPATLLRQGLTGSKANPSYGLTFWLNRGAPHGREVDIEGELDLPWKRAGWSDICICKNAPTDMIACIGSGHQRLFIIPSVRAIIVRQGQNAKFSDAHFLRLVLGP